jgi:hypothetical protein
MGNEITTRPTGSAIPWQPPQLDTSLAKMVDPDLVWVKHMPLPVLTDEQRAAAERALAIFAEMPRGTAPVRVASMMGQAALAYPNGRLSPQETDARLAIYQRELADIDEDILSQAFRMAVRNGKFFPSIAELRDFARHVPTPRRLVIAARLRALVANVPAPPVEYIEPGQLSALFQSATKSLSVQEEQHAA